MNKQTITFGAVGIINTTVDFIIFLVLNKIGLYVLLANFISTSVALICSFLLNRKFTFSKRNTKREHQFKKFILTTIVGLWIIQPLLIQFFLFGEKLSGISEVLSDITSFVDLNLVVAKIIAIAGSMTWNYLWYSRYVFKHHDEDNRDKYNETK